MYRHSKIYQLWLDRRVAPIGGMRGSLFSSASLLAKALPSTLMEFVMKQKLVFALTGVALAAALSLSPAHAFSPLAAGRSQAESVVQQVHFRHRSCERGLYGWHRHVGPYGVRMPCYPTAWNPYRCWVDRYGFRHCWW